MKKLLIVLAILVLALNAGAEEKKKKSESPFSKDIFKEYRTNPEKGTKVEIGSTKINIEKLFEPTKETLEYKKLMHTQIGRYQLYVLGPGFFLLLDTASGKLWRFQR